MKNKAPILPRPWPRGLATKLAIEAGLKPRVFLAMLRRSRPVPLHLRVRISEVTQIPEADLADVRRATHHAFKGPVIEKNARDFWEHGAQSLIAARAGVSSSVLNRIVHRTRRVEPGLALKLERASGVPAREWASNRQSEHPAFVGGPRGEF